PPRLEGLETDAENFLGYVLRDGPVAQPPCGEHPERHAECLELGRSGRGAVARLALGRHVTAAHHREIILQVSKTAWHSSFLGSPRVEGRTCVQTPEDCPDRRRRRALERGRDRPAGR